MNITGEIGSEEELTTDEPRTPRKNPLNVPGVTLHAPPCPACGGTKKIHKGERFVCEQCPEKIFRTAYDLHDHEVLLFTLT